MPAPTRVLGVTPAVGWASTASPKTTPAFDVVSGDLLVLTGFSEDSPALLSVPTWTGTGTWTLQQSIVVSSYCTAYIYTCPVTATASGRTISVARTGSVREYSFVASVWRNHGGVGVSGKSNSSGAPSLTLTTAANSALVMGNSDWNAADGTTRTWRTVNGSAITESSYGGQVGVSYTAYTGYVLDAGSAGSKTVGLTVPSSQKYSIIGVEILGTSGGSIPESVGSVPVTVGLSAATVPVGVAVGVLALAIGMSGATVPVGVRSGSAPISVGLTASSIPVATVRGSLPVAVGLSGATAQDRISTGTLPLTAGLQSVSVPVGVARGSLPLTVGLAGATVSVGTRTGTLPLTVGITGSSQNALTAAGTLPLLISLTGATIPVGVSSGRLPVTIGLVGVASPLLTSTGSIPVSIQLVGAVNGEQRDIKVTGMLEPRRITATLTPRTITGALNNRRWAGTL